MKTMKRIAAFVFAISFCFVLALSPSANAQGLLPSPRFGAWIASALASLNIIGNVASAATTMNELYTWYAKPYSEQITDFLYSTPEKDLADYLNSSTIKVRQGVITIDGEVYDELWFPPGLFIDGLKTNAFDFKTKWSIASGQVGTLAKGAGFLNGVPIYQIGSQLRSQTYIMEYNLGDYQLGNYVLNNYKNTYNPRLWQLLNGSSQAAKGSGWVGQAYFDTASGGAKFHYKTDPQVDYYVVNIFQSYTAKPFQYDFVSGIVPAEKTDIPEEYGMSLKIPHDQLETFYTTYPQYNVDNSVINIEQDQIDIDQLTQAIFDQIQSMEDVKAEWTSGEEPEPPAPVDPVESIDENVQSINQYQQNMNQQVNQMHQDVEAIHQTQQQQQQVQQQMQQTQQQMLQDTSSIESTLKDVTATPGQSDLPSFKFDLRELFPFCIPFDIYRLLSSFDAEPAAPHVRLPIVIQSIGFNYTLDLDFSSWDTVAQAMRTAELIVYAIGLAWATGKVIKW